MDWQASTGESGHGGASSDEDWQARKVRQEQARSRQGRAGSASRGHAWHGGVVASVRQVWLGMARHG